MKGSLTILLMLTLSVYFVNAQDQAETTYKQNCASCHTIGKGRLVGPDLANIEPRLKRDWLIKWIKASQDVVKSGDEYAKKIFAEYNSIPMPNVPLSDNEINQILDYIASKSSSATTAETVAPTEPVTTAATGNVDKGKELFVGNARFAKGGPTCNACHNVEKAGIISGGAMAKDLTDLSTRMDEAGVKATIGGMLAGIPAMKQSFEEKPLTDQEIADLAAFLASPAQETDKAAAPSEANIMMIAGLIGAGIFIMFLIPIIWMKRKKNTVNQKIFERQTKSLH